jgi:broad specificity phosphatase PhoE
VQRQSVMSGDTRPATQQTYLVEHYRPSSTGADLEHVAAQVRKAVDELEREGRPVRFRHSTVVATDESFLCVVEAASEDLIRLAFDRASVTFERISAARTEQS